MLNPLNERISALGKQVYLLCHEIDLNRLAVEEQGLRTLLLAAELKLPHTQEKADYGSFQMLRALSKTLEDVAAQSQFS